MNAPKTLRKPTNWQDFEQLCKKLWGEIWLCPEIKKNGRSGQAQSGVDIYGMPAGESAYFGIQCKGKDEYLHAQFSTREILAEVKKAQSFQPALRKLYLATTANKDVKVEQFVRELDVESRSNGLFEIHIFCWEDIVDLIDENRQTHDWYLHSANFKISTAAEVTFEDGSNSLALTPNFIEVWNKFYQKKSAFPRLSEDDDDQQVDQFSLRSMISFGTVSANHSFVRINLKIRNTGSAQIDNFKLIMQMDGNLVDRISDSNMDYTGTANVLGIKRKDDDSIEIDEKLKIVSIAPKKSFLVPEDHYITPDIFFKPKPYNHASTIAWTLLSSNFKDSGEIVVSIYPDLQIKYSPQLGEPREEFVGFEDFITKERWG